MEAGTSVPGAQQMTANLQTAQGFRHEALLYRGDADFVVRASAFLREAAAEDEPALVVVSEQKIGMLRDELGSDAGAITFADMADVGQNPARIIPAWRSFVEEQSAHVERFRGIGEPIWAARTSAELVECQRHEALLNLAFGEGPAWWLLCPYDADALTPDVIDEAYRTHPFVENSATQPSDAHYREASRTVAPTSTPLPAPRGAVEAFTVDGERLNAARRWVRAHAVSFGLCEERVVDLVLATSEVATNSLTYGGGTAEVRTWNEGDTMLCEVADEGYITQALAGRVRPVPGQASGYGLWIANQLCDLVQIRALEGGTVVRLHMAR